MMSDPNTRIVVLAAVDQTAASREVIRTAMAISRANHAADLHFVNAVDRSLAERVAEGSTYLDTLIDDAVVLTPGRVAGRLSTGDPVKSILHVAIDVGADLLVVGTREKRGLSGLLGSVSRKLLRRAPCAVLLARGKSSRRAVPKIEPPCPTCVDVRFTTDGEQLWCERQRRGTSMATSTTERAGGTARARCSFDRTGRES